MGVFLRDLQTGQKFELCLLRILKGMPFKDLANHVHEEWGFEITRQTIGNFFRSAEGLELMEKAYEHLRKEYSNEPLVEKSTRVLALKEQTEKIQAILRTVASDSEEWLSYSQEFRQYVKQIAVEMEGIQVNVTDGKAAAERAIEAAIAKKAKLELVV
jgi:histidinol-phosphate/aromatic aminotransferase/cobyric acid decarboxylase-like protein